MEHKSCRRQTRSKYTSRKGPPYPARACYEFDPSLVVMGNDGEAYEIRVASNGVPRWAKLSHKKGSKRSKKRKSSSPKRSKKRRSSSPKRSKKRRSSSPKRSKKRSSSSPSVPVSRLTRAQVIKKLRYWRDRWERASKKNQDLDDVRLREESLPFLRKALRSYMSDQFMEWLAEYEEAGM